MVRRNETGVPDYPTCVRSRLSGGRLLGTDGSMWMYRAVPLNPVVDAATPAEAIAAAEPILSAFDELAAMTHVSMARRATARGAYRQVHLLLMNVPTQFSPPPDHPIGQYLATSFAHQAVDRRVLLFGVRIHDKVTSGGLKQAVDSVKETLLQGSVPIEDFAADSRAVSAALGRAGLQDASDADLMLASSWWTHGDRPDVVMMEHATHLHVFNSADDAVPAAEAGRDCSSVTWDALDQYAMTFASVQDFDFEVVRADDYRAWWVPRLMQAGAIVVSLRGGIEPAKVTRAELRRRKKQFMDDLTEQAQNNKMERAEQQEALARLDQAEAAYSMDGAPPVLTDASIVVALDGRIGDIDEVSHAAGLKLRTMDYRQLAAMSETWPCSNIRANPHLHDLPAQTVACSGLPSIAKVGDKDGAMIGLTEMDRQPAFLSPTAAAKADSLPMGLVAGATGSGKAVTLVTPIPTPSGWTTMGDLRIGDEVLGRDGKPTRVSFLSEINETPDLFDIHLSDGQVIRADREHQWIVSDFRDRHDNNRQKHVAAQGRWDEAQALIERLRELSEQADDVDISITELTRFVRARVPEAPWNAVAGVREALTFVGCPYRMEDRRAPRNNPTVTKTDPVVLFPLDEALEANLAMWRGTTGGNATRWRHLIEGRIAAAERLIADDRLHKRAEQVTAAELARRLRSAGADYPKTSKNRLADVARAAGVEGVPGFTEVTITPTSAVGTTERPAMIFNLPVALKALATRVEQQYGDRPVSGVSERRMSTGEMIDAGLRVSYGNHRNFAIRVTEPVDLPDADLPVDPYVFGAWLGDGTTKSGQICQGESDACTDDERITDMTHMLGQISSAGYAPRRVKSNSFLIAVPGLVGGLRKAGVFGRKRIPVEYLRSSAEQRLAVLQGLMDTDGTVDQNGCCELSLCDERLANDALELIRSLGIKCAMTSGPATITEIDPDRPGRKRRRVTGTRWRMHFTTDRTVFRLPRKARRIPETVRSTQQWFYITDIVPVPTEPARCIQVDNDDHTYLLGGFVPSSNTMMMLWVADQYARSGSPVVIIDPKMGSDHTAAVEASGGQVASLDDLARADGVFDPLRFAATPEAGVDMAGSMLMAVNPWGSMAQDFETPLMSALRYGVDNGASCIGEALRMAERAGKAPKEMVDGSFSLAEASPMFRACMGINPGTQPLRVAEGITLIKVGNAHLELPEPGALKSDLTSQQRVASALVRMMVFGSASALTGRQGVLLVDEAWTVLSAGKSEVERLGRLARSQGVLPMLFTQRVSDAVNAGLTGYISRGLILPIQDKVEAEAACELFELEATPERLSRITARGTMGGGDGSGAAPNWNSMRHLRDPKSGQTLRGSVAIYADLHGRAVPVEILIPQSFMDRASTNPDDIRRRDAAAAADSAPELAASTTRAVVPARPQRPEVAEVDDEGLGIDDFDFDFE